MKGTGSEQRQASCNEMEVPMVTENFVAILTRPMLYLRGTEAKDVKRFNQSLTEPDSSGWGEGD